MNQSSDLNLTNKTSNYNPSIINVNVNQFAESVNSNSKKRRLEILCHFHFKMSVINIHELC